MEINHKWFAFLASLLIFIAAIGNFYGKNPTYFVLFGIYFIAYAGYLKLPNA